MAKQSGIHQIKGKIGEHSYYRQTGISSGLIRQINQGMSERVKTSPEYANTRLNNIEFTIATQTAGALFAGVQPILRPTRTLFRTSRFAAELYHILEHTPGNWGDVIFTDDSRQEMVMAMHKFAKRKMSEYADIRLGAYNSTTHKMSIEIVPQRDIAAYMHAMGANFMRFEVYQLQLYTTALPSEVGYVNPAFPVIQPVEVENYDLDASDPGMTITTSIDCYGPSLILGINATFLPFIAVVALPIRKTADGEQILQDRCTFTIMPDPNDYSQNQA